MKQRDLYTRVEQPAPALIYIPFTRPTMKLQLIIDCLRAQQVQPKLVEVGNDDRYWRMLRDSWAEGGEFFVVEQDVAVWQGGIQALADCAFDWCTLPTMCHGRMISTTFGCVKFSERLISRNPGFWEDIPTDWFHLDANFADKMGWPFLKPHVHWPAATHLNEIQWPDEISTRFALERKMVWQAHEAGGQVARVQYRLDSDDRGAWWRWGWRKGTHIGSAQVTDE